MYEDLSSDRIQVAFLRAARSTGQVGAIACDDVSFLEAFEAEMNAMRVADTLAEMHEQGIAVIVGTTDDGHHEWEVAAA